MTGTRIACTMDYLYAVARVCRKSGNRLHGYYCLEDFILRNGRRFEFQLLPEGVKRGAMTECFRNAAMLAFLDDRLTYCEGYAMGVIPVMHAWCVDRRGVVLDPTWEDGTDYFGVAIKTEYVMARILARRSYGVIDDPEHRWPMLKTRKAKWSPRS